MTQLRSDKSGTNKSTVGYQDHSGARLEEEKRLKTRIEHRKGAENECEGKRIRLQELKGRTTSVCFIFGKDEI